jgi:sulfur relay (sulfurtransferase) complex TusBCD TusD component (DsrE family)
VDDVPFCEMMLAKLHTRSKQKMTLHIIILQTLLKKLQVELAICDNSTNAKGINSKVLTDSQTDKSGQTNFRVR